MAKKAVVLLSGGLDSTTCLAIARSKDFECYTLCFDYGQKHRSELTAAAQISELWGAKEHKIFPLPMNEFGGSALTDAALDVPDYQGTPEIPITYVPARNTIFLSLALAFAEVIKAYDIFIGVSAVDYSHYPDCRPEFISQFQRLADMATKDGTKGNRFMIHTPIIHLSKAQTICAGLKLGVDYSWTISCYQADVNGKACGRCNACMLRKKGFRESGIPDPTTYF